MTIKGEKGFALILVLILVAMGAMAVTPALRLASTSLKSKAIHTEILEDQYARDGAAEFAIWQLQYSDLTTLLNDPLECPDNTCSYDVVLNGITTSVVVRMRTELGTNSVAGSEGNAIRPSVKKVECDANDGQGFTDDCSIPTNGPGMVARYTIELKQISPDSEPLVAIYDEMPSGLNFRQGTVATDGSFPEILPEVTDIFPENIGSSQDEIWKWTFSPPISFQQGDVKTFTFEVDIDNKNNERYCNDTFLKMENPPHEQVGKSTDITVGSPPEGCSGGGVNLEKGVDTLVLQPGVTTVLTYIINVENLDTNPTFVDNIKDVLPQGGFLYCDSGTVPVCDDPMYKVVNAPADLNPLSGSYTDLNGFVPLNAPEQTPPSGNDRWELLWDFTGTSSCALPGGCSASGLRLEAAGDASSDTLVIRFQTVVTLEVSGSYYNEVFTDISCSIPPVLGPGQEAVTTSQEYCASYSWPSGGTLVPMYDVQSNAERTSGQGNISVGVGGDAALESWNVDEL